MSFSVQPMQASRGLAITGSDCRPWSRLQPRPPQVVGGLLTRNVGAAEPTARHRHGAAPTQWGSCAAGRLVHRSAGVAGSGKDQPRDDRWQQKAQAKDTVATDVEAGDDLEECELVLGKELQLGEGQDSFGAHLAEAVKNRNGSGVLLLTDIMGYQNADTRDFAYRLACFGYSVLAPDLFRGEPWEPTRPKSEYEAWREQHVPERVAADIATSVEYLQTNVVHDRASPGNGRLAILGFCFGGGRLVETLAQDVAGRFSTAVFFYGTRFDPSLASAIRVPMLLITGDSDALCSVDTAKQLESQVAGSQALIFPGRGHAFAHHPESMEDDDDAEKAFQATKGWLHDHLLAGAPGPWASDSPYG